MNIAIYQINPDRDENNVAFLNYENLERFQGSAALRSEIYDKVFEGEVECGTLEEVYQMFNIGQPDGYRGRSLSVLIDKLFFTFTYNVFFCFFCFWNIWF